MEKNKKIELMFCDKIFRIDAARIGRTVVVRDGVISKEIDMLGFKEFFQAHFDDIKCDPGLRYNAFIEAIDEAICAWRWGGARCWVVGFPGARCTEKRFGVLIGEVGDGYF